MCDWWSVGNPVTNLSTIVPEDETMASTDIDGSVIVILSVAEAQRVYDRIKIAPSLDDTEKGLLRKIVRDLKLEQPK